MVALNLVSSTLSAASADLLMTRLVVRLNISHCRLKQKPQYIKSCNRVALLKILLSRSHDVCGGKSGGHGARWGGGLCALSVQKILWEYATNYYLQLLYNISTKGRNIITKLKKKPGATHNCVKTRYWFSASG
jgi:hypothetical protein